MAEAGPVLGNSVHWVKEHPYATAGLVFVGGAILVYVYYSGGSPAPVDGSAAVAAAQLQHEAVQAQYGAQLAAQQSQLQAAAAQVSGGVAVAKMQTDAATEVATLQLQQNLAGIDASKAIALAQVEASNKATSAQQAVQLAGITAQTDLAHIQADQQTAQTAALVGFLNAEIGAQYGYLNNQVNQATTISLAGLDLQRHAFDANVSGLTSELQGLRQTINGAVGAATDPRDAAWPNAQIINTLAWLRNPGAVPVA